jgi:four helix bundle protein
MAKTVEELPIFKKATEFSVAVDAILERPAFGRNRKHREQIAEANESITANMREGFEQSTDDGFASYLYTAKGSLGEVLARLARAKRKRWLTAEELSAIDVQGEELGKMLGGFIKYLARSGFKNRGRHTARQLRKQD